MNRGAVALSGPLTVGRETTDFSDELSKINRENTQMLNDETFLLPVCMDCSVKNEQNAGKLGNKPMKTEGKSVRILQLKWNVSTEGEELSIENVLTIEKRLDERRVSSRGFYETSKRKAGIFWPRQTLSLINEVSRLLT